MQEIVMEKENETKYMAQSLLSAAARHDAYAVKNLLKTVSANVQNDADGRTPLHSAIEGNSASPHATAANTSSEGRDETTANIVQILFENGAIWNDLDKNDETPGCIANRLNLKKTYTLIVDAGIRAEILLSKLDAFNDNASDEFDENTSEQEFQKQNRADENEVSKDVSDVSEGNADASANSSEYPPPDDYIDRWNSNASFLKSNLRYTDTTLYDHSSNAVMMDWETEIMTRHAKTLLPSKGLRAMNIGHGMGIVDAAIQDLEPSEHHIIEAHPAVIEQMRAKGWFEKPGVFIHQGRWQDVLPKLVEKGVILDAIYYDTFAEDYKDLRELFSEHVIGLLDQSGRFGFYNGMGADRKVCYDVYTGVVEIDLGEAGFSTNWEDIPVPKVDWKGVRRPYWNVDVYRLPICTFI